MKNLVQKALQFKSLLHKKGQGRKRTIFDIGNRTLHEIVQEYGGELSQMTLCELVRRKGVNISQSTISKILRGPDWTRFKSKSLPINTAVHQQNRFEFASQNINNSFGGNHSSTLWVDIDEKNFYSFTRRIVYCPKEQENMFKYIHQQSKTNIESVMFFGAVAKPRPEENFDGRILLMPVCTKERRKRNGKYGQKGDILYKKAVMNKALFILYIKEYLLPQIHVVADQLSSVHNVVVQLDQAGGHGGGRSNMKCVLDQLNEMGAKERKKVTFIIQPSR